MNHTNMVLYITEKTKKTSSKKKWTNREYHVQHNEDVKLQDVEIYCATNQFPEFWFFWTHNKPYGVCGLGNYYCMCFGTKLVHGTCAIFCIPLACTFCTSILDQPLVTGFTEHQQPVGIYYKLIPN